METNLNELPENIKHAYDLGYESYKNDQHENPFPMVYDMSGDHTEFSEYEAWYDGYDQASDEAIALEIFNEGYFDFRDGVSIENNPYSEELEIYFNEWAKGWNAAMRDADYV